MFLPDRRDSRKSLACVDANPKAPTGVALARAKIAQLLERKSVPSTIC
jgi:histidinol-phosphate/aromatic aminotransferase/cobyric acid decarboxylase-like protein